MASNLNCWIGQDLFCVLGGGQIWVRKCLLKSSCAATPKAPLGKRPAKNRFQMHHLLHHPIYGKSISIGFLRADLNSVRVLPGLFLESLKMLASLVGKR